MSEIKVSEQMFIELCFEFNFNVEQIAKRLAEIPGYEVRPYRIRDRIANYRKRGLLPLESGNSVTYGQVLRGTSTLYAPDGSIKQQWVKTDQSKQDLLDQFSAAIESISNTVVPVSPIPAPDTSLASKLAVYPIGDAHIGLLAWAPETGEDCDLNIIQTRMLAAMSLLVDQALPTDECFIVDVGKLIAA